MKSPQWAIALAILTFGPRLMSETTGGEVFAWGRNTIGEGTNTPIHGVYRLAGPVTIAGEKLRDVVSISAGEGHGLALKEDGTVFGWGWNFSGQATGSKSLLSDCANGQVRIAGNPLRDVMAISAGGGFSLAVKSNGTVVAWGEGLAEKERSQVTVPTSLNEVVSVAVGWNYSIALRRDGTVIGWGIRKVPAGLSNIVAIAAGGDYFGPSLALRNDGKVVEWSPGVETENGSIVVSNATAIAAGSFHCLALLRDGTVYGWGQNGGGEATGIPTTVAPYSSSGLVKIGGETLSNVKVIAAGKGHSLALKQNGTLVAWGRMNNGIQPATIPQGLRNVTAIAAGDDFCLALTTNAAAFSPK